MSRSRMPSTPWLLRSVAAVLAIPLLLSAQAARAEVTRCEDAKGRVTYSNAACPEGTTKERPVTSRSAVEVPDSGAGASAEQIGVRRSGAASPAATPSAASRDDARALVAYCDDLVRRIGFRQQDLLSTTGNERASAELGLRRLQDEHQSNCEHH